MVYTHWLVTTVHTDKWRVPGSLAGDNVVYAQWLVTTVHTYWLVTTVHTDRLVTMVHTDWWQCGPLSLAGDNMVNTGWWQWSTLTTYKWFTPTTGYNGPHSMTGDKGGSVHTNWLVTTIHTDWWQRDPHSLTDDKVVHIEWYISWKVIQFAMSQKMRGRKKKKERKKRRRRRVQLFHGRYWSNV